MNCRSAITALLLAALYAASLTEARAQPREFAHSYHEPFQGKPRNPDDFVFVGKDVGDRVKFEPEGLRITLPPGKKVPVLGLATAFGVEGDFEVTVAYEVMQEPKAADAGADVGTRISLALTLNHVLNNEAALRRKITATQPLHIVAWRRLKRNLDSPADDQAQMAPVTAKTGRFRMVRTGADIQHYVAQGDDKEFVLMGNLGFSADVIKDVQLTASTGSDAAGVDMRFHDLHIKAAALPRKLPTPKIDAADTKIPDKEYAQTYAQTFKSDLKPDGWNFASRLSEEGVQFEKEGLRFTLPVGPQKVQNAGMVSAFSVKGDFEITLNFEVLKDPEPADVGKSGSRLSLAVTLDTPALDTPQSEVSTLSRSMTTRGFVAWMRNRGFPKSITQTFATPAKTGRLRMVRSGDDLYQLASVGVDQPLQYLKKFRFGAEDLKRVVLTTASDGEKSFVDVRVTDLRIRADAIPGAPNVVVRTAEGKEEIVAAPAAPEERSKVWLLAGAGVAIAILGALVLALLLSKRGKAPGAPAESTTSMVSFACPNCAKALKANADSAGKRVKCPKCATGVMVPAVETSQT